MTAYEAQCARVLCDCLSHVQHEEARALAGEGDIAEALWALCKDPVACRTWFGGRQREALADLGKEKRAFVAVSDAFVDEWMGLLRERHALLEGVAFLGSECSHFATSEDVPSLAECILVASTSPMSMYIPVHMTGAFCDVEHWFLLQLTADSTSVRADVYDSAPQRIQDNHLYRQEKLQILGVFHRALVIVSDLWQSYRQSAPNTCLRWEEEGEPLDQHVYEVTGRAFSECAELGHMEDGPFPGQTLLRVGAEEIIFNGEDVSGAFAGESYMYVFSEPDGRGHVEVATWRR